ncbi:SDR family NAD(P)-dependent oxidoreductase [Dactylosporangium salmoneum]|uniref:SDR family NAD(P)-dependent oxidoreductase n=1 Tax=Dactylosporangium salmoneum TaxID=53361 RepID=A0ABP5SWD3_9ACTN
MTPLEPLLRRRPGLIERVRGRLQGTVAVVTGAGSHPSEVVGVGQAISAVLAAAGARVVVVDLDEQAARHTADAITGLDPALTAYAAIGDVRRRADCEAVIAAAVERFGAIDVLVNNAAIIGPGAALADDDEGFLQTLDVNLMGAVRMSRAAAGHMRRGSAIVHISSLGSLRSFGNLAYEASKGAINTLVSSMSIQLGAAGIRVNGVCPGQMWTPMAVRNLRLKGYSDDAIAAHRSQRRDGLPLRMEGTGWDIATATLFLAGPESCWITGQTLVVDGGQSGVVGYLPPDGG